MADSNTEGDTRPMADPVGPEQPEPAREELAREEPAGGESACLLHLVCAECGALTEQRPPVVCWRCGAPVGPE
jgi:rubrerythrin